MNAQATPRQDSLTRRNLRLSTRDGAWYCIMLGFGEVNIALFGSLIGLKDVGVALLGGLPQVLGASLAAVTPYCILRHRSHKAWMVRSAVVQGAAFGAMALGAVLGWMPWPVIFGITIIYWAANLSCGATWNTLISTLVPPRVRARYFSRRSPVLNLVQVGAVFFAGWILQLQQSPRDALAIVAGLFFVSFLCRLSSAYTLWLHTERNPVPAGFRVVPWSELVGRFSKGVGGRILVYRLSVQIATSVSTPFVVPYLLLQRGLNKDYVLFGLLTGLLMLAKALAAPFCGGIAHRFGPRALLRLGGLAIVPTPALWLFGNDLLSIALVQIFSGISLAAYELATLLILFETVDECERTSVLAKFNIADNAAVAVGTVLGGAALHHFAMHGVDTARMLGAFLPAFVHAPAYGWLFAIAAVFRVFTLPLLTRVPPLNFRTPTSSEAVLEIHPLPGATDLPMIASHHDDRRDFAARQKSVDARRP